MAVFEYRGIQIDSGKAVKGYRDAENAKALRALLRRDGSCSRSRPKRASASSAPGATSTSSRSSGGSTTADVAIMTRQLATLVRAGVPLVESLDRAHRAGRKGAAGARC